MDLKWLVLIGGNGVTRIVRFEILNFGLVGEFFSLGIVSVRKHILLGREEEIIVWSQVNPMASSVEFGNFERKLKIPCAPYENVPTFWVNLGFGSTTRENVI